MRKYVKIGVVAFILILAVVLLLLMTFIIDNIYDCESPIIIFDVELSKSDILDYYAQLLSLLATIIRLVWKFTCKDGKGNKHFYSANIFIPDTREHNNEFWEITKIG